MNPEIIERIINVVAPDGYTPREESEKAYPPRQLPENAYVTRVCPSPTGFVHIGTIYAGLTCERLAHQSGGVFYVRIEDTDKKREVEGAMQQIIASFADYGLQVDEGTLADGTAKGAYGPYIQSERAKMYLGYAVELLKKGRAYPAFDTPEELDDNYKAQQAAKVRPGYYGQWAKWRDRPQEDVKKALDAGLPLVLRFKSQGSHEQRVVWNDALRRHMDVPQNDQDVPLIKSDGTHLPTYHLAHVVDDHLMHTTVVLRGEEWITSTPLHLELTEALGWPLLNYGHYSVISIMDGSSKRKLSKRKDPQANVAYFAEAGYPTDAVVAYLLGLANSTFEDWWKQNPDKSVWDYPFSLERWATSRNPLLDMQKLDDISKEIIAKMPQPEFVQNVHNWAAKYGVEFCALLEQNPEYTEQVLSIERTGGQVRKDLAKWSDAPDQYSYFFDEWFAQHGPELVAAELQGVPPEEQKAVTTSFLETYNSEDPQDEWFNKVKQVAEKLGYATNMKDYRQNPDSYKGSVADVAKILRVKLTGRNRTPDLWALMRVMGVERVRARLTA